MKAYSGNDKPFYLALFAEEDRERAMELLEELDRRGYALCGFEEDADADKAKRAAGVLAFLSGAFADEVGLQELVYAADAADVPVIPVRLDGSAMPEALEASLMASNAIMAERYGSAAELADRVASAEAFEKPRVSSAQKSGQKRRTGLLALAAVLALTGIAFFVFSQASASPDAEIARMAEEQYGMTAEDLAAIHELTVNGEHLVWVTEDDVEAEPYGGEYPDAYFFATHSEDEDGTVHWYWKEDGSETVRTGYDWSFLTILPNLEYLNIANADLAGMPSLTGLEQLSTVDLYSCTLPEDGLSFLGGSRVRSMEISGCNVADYSPLTDCGQLERIWLDAVQGEMLDLSGFAPPALKHLNVEQAEGDLADLAACTQLEDLELFRCPDIVGLGFLEGCTSLENLTLEDCGALTDASALASCTNLRDFYVNWSYDLRDLSFLDDLTKLEHVALLSVPVRDFGFLENLEEKDGFDLAFCPSQPEGVDWSGLAAISRYSHLHLNPDSDAGGSYADILPHIADATIDNLELYDCRSVDLATLPHVAETLRITHGDLSSLAGLDQPDMTNLVLDGISTLTSLDGLDGAPSVCGIDGFGDLEVNSCVRLSDWSALKGRMFEILGLRYLYALPDLSGVNASSLCLEAVEGVTDLAFLDSMELAEYLGSLELVGLEQLGDLSPAARLHGQRLVVGPELADQAQALVEAGNFSEFEVAYPEGGWEQLEGFTLLSLDELDTLPQALLDHVSCLRLAGSTVFDWSEGTSYEWDDETQGMAAVNEATGEKTPLGQGTLTDLTRLGALTGLRELTLLGQPLTSLDGIQNLDRLAFIELDWCNDIEDFSALFACPTLEEVELLGANVTSIQGIQNLTQLEEVALSWNRELDDLTPLLECPNLQHVRVSSDMEEALSSIEGMDLPFELEIEQAGAEEEAA